MNEFLLWMSYPALRMRNCRSIPGTSTILALAVFYFLAACTNISPEKARQEMNGAAGSAHESEMDCGDLLGQFGKKPEQLEFLECTVVNAPQVARSARYRVSGKMAEVVEDFLQEEYGMNELQFLCCGWEPKEGRRGSLETLGHYFSITMYSDETLVSDRTHWSEIPFFYVVVEELVNI